MDINWGKLLILVGAGAIALGFYLQAQLNRSNAVGAYLGASAAGSPGPWVVGGAGVIAIIAGVVLLSQKSSGSRIAAGWHDDPESPDRLRYHDGREWTGKTAAKS